jgi:putative membrane protein
MPSEAGLRRLHPLSLLFLIGGQAKRLLLPGILVLFFASRQGHGELWFMLLFIPAVIGALFRYGSYRYRLGQDELLIREGVVFRNERHIPYARIQNIDLVQNPLHRMLRVAEIRLETAGGQQPEAVLCVLSLDAVQRMRTRIFSGRPDPGPETAGAVQQDPGVSTAGPLHVMRLSDVILFGLISNKGMVVVAAAMGLVWQLDLVDRWTSTLSRESLERYRALIPKDDFLVAGLLGLAALVALLVFMRLLSVIWAVGKFQGFRLTRRGDDLRAEYGALTRISKTIPCHRIQVLSTRESVLHRWLGRVAVQVETAGSTGEKEGPSTNRLWLAPLIRKERVATLFHEVLPQVDLEALRWQSISTGARGRLFRKAIYTAAPITVAALYFFGAWGLFVPALLLSVRYWTSGLYVKHTGYAIAPGAIFFRSGWWVRCSRVVRFSKIQSLENSESPFDRRHGMASLKVDTAGAARVGHSIDMPYLDVGVATQMMNRLYDEAGRTAFRW